MDALPSPIHAAGFGSSCAACGGGGADDFTRSGQRCGRTLPHVAEWERRETQGLADERRAIELPGPATRSKPKLLTKFAAIAACDQPGCTAAAARWSSNPAQPSQRHQNLSTGPARLLGHRQRARPASTPRVRSQGRRQPGRAGKRPARPP